MGYCCMSKWMPRVLLILLLAGIVFGFGAPASAGAPSPLDGFSANLDNQVNAVVQQPDGKVLVCGAFTSINGTSRNRIARLNADGSLDTTFDPGLGADGTVNALALQADGKVLLGGSFSTIHHTTCHNIARLNTDGTLDPTFTISANYNVMSMVRQPDGKVLLGGHFVTINTTSRKGIARLNADGTLDTTFNPAITAEFVNAVALAPDGKVLLGGGTTSPIARLNADGSVDTTFNWPSKPEKTWIHAMAVQPDGKVLLGGNFSSISDTARTHIARLNTDGSLDMSFAPNLSGGTSDGIKTLAVQADGKLLLGGSITRINGTLLNNIARLNTDGTVDTTFNTGGGANIAVNTLVVQADGKALLGGQFTSVSGVARNRIARLNADGTLDDNLAIGTGAMGGPVNALAQQPDRKVLIGGDFTTFNGTARNRIARLNADGALDTTFNPGTGAGATVNALALQPDGKVLLGGDFTSINITPRSRIARLNADGSPDTTFDPGTGANNKVYALALQADGKVLLGGDFTSINGTTRNRIARLNADGSLDLTFDPGTGANTTVFALALQADGKVLLGGGFTTINGTTRACIARLNANGGLDTTFNPGTGAGAAVFTLALQPDGKVLLGGQFTTFNGTARNRIMRLNADGSPDATFNPGTGANTTVSALALQSDGKVLLGGQFATINGTARVRVARLNADGSLDTTYDPGTGANDDVSALALQPDGKLLLGGWFTSMNGTGSNRIARLSNPDGAWQELTVGTNGDSATWSLAGSAAQLGQVLFEHSADGAIWSPLGWSVAEPGVGYHLTGLNLPIRTDHYLRATGWVPGSTGGNGLYRSVRIFHVVPIQYTLTYIAGANGSINGATSTTLTINHGANGTAVTAVPDTGYHFVQWSDGVLTAARTDVGVKAAKSVTATFAINQYTLTYIAGAHGSINGVSSVTQTVNHGSNGSQVTANPSAGYHFVKWVHDSMDFATINPLTLTNLQKALTLVAVFEKTNAVQDWSSYH